MKISFESEKGTEILEISPSAYECPRTIRTVDEIIENHATSPLVQALAYESL